VLSLLRDDSDNDLEDAVRARQRDGSRGSLVLEVPRRSNHRVEATWYSNLHVRGRVELEDPDADDVTDIKRGRRR
jgi:hypothetical protein